MPPLRLEKVPSGLGTADLFVTIEDDDAPIVRVDLYADQSPFRRSLRSLLPYTDKPSPMRRTSLCVCPAQRTGIHGSMDARAASDKRLLTGRFELGQFALQFAPSENLRRAVLGDFVQDPAIAVRLESQVG